MTYRKLLELYKNGVLEEKEMEQVRKDIEKQDAISEYLYNESSLLSWDEQPEEDSGTENSGDFITESSEGSSELPPERREGKAGNYHAARDRAASVPDLRPGQDSMEEKFVQMIRRSIRRAFIRMGIAVGAVLLVLLLFFQLALPGIVSLFYYDPGKAVTAGSESGRMSLDMAVYTELMVPGYHRDHVSVRDNGFGDYEIVIHQNYSLNQIFTNITGRIRRNHLILYNNNILSPPSSNMFEWYNYNWDPALPLSEQITEPWIEEEDGSLISVNSCAAGSPEDALEHLKELSGDRTYIAYVSLNREMDYDEFVQYAETLDLGGLWCAPRTREKSTDNLGFYYFPSCSTSVDWDEEAYPALQLWKTAPSDSGYEEQMENMRSEEYARTHFVSMLRYLSRQKTFCEMMKEAGCLFSAEHLEPAAEYVEEHGLRIYGFSVVTDKETLLDLNEDENVYVISTEPLQ